MTHRLLLMLTIVASSLVPACVMQARPDGYVWACDTAYPNGTGGVGVLCVNTGHRWRP